MIANVIRTLFIAIVVILSLPGRLLACDTCPPQLTLQKSDWVCLIKVFGGVVDKDPLLVNLAACSPVVTSPPVTTSATRWTQSTNNNATNNNNTSIAGLKVPSIDLDQITDTSEKSKIYFLRRIDVECATRLATKINMYYGDEVTILFSNCSILESG